MQSAGMLTGSQGIAGVAIVMNYLLGRVMFAASCVMQNVTSLSSACLF